MKMQCRWISVPLLAAGSMLLALVIYVNCRQASFLFSKPLDELGLTSFLYSERITDLHLPSWVAQSLPDGLWMLAFSLTITMIWEFKITRSFIIWFGIGLGLGVTYEVMQCFHFFPGTFDWIDLFSILFLGTLPFITLWVFKGKRDRIV